MILIKLMGQNLFRKQAVLFREPSNGTEWLEIESKEGKHQEKTSEQKINK